MRVDLGLRLEQFVRTYGRECWWEHPGYLSVKVGDKFFEFGDVNECWGFDVRCGDELLDHADLSVVPSSVRDVNVVGLWILFVLRCSEHDFFWRS